MERSKHGTDDHCLPDWGEPNPRNSVTKLQPCLGVRAENLSSKKIARVENLQQNVSFEFD